MKVRPDSVETYNAFRLKILTPSGLAAGNLMLRWNPANDETRIHRFVIYRGSETIDVLKTSTFRVVDSDDQSDVEALSGDLVARLQAKGLEVGDEIEVAQSQIHSNKTFEGRAFGIVQWPLIETRGAFRFRLSRPNNIDVRWKAAKGVSPPRETELNGSKDIWFEAQNLAAVDRVDGAPGRYNIRRRIEYSSFANWSDVSNMYWRLSDPKSALPPNSPIGMEADKIAASTQDAKTRALAALRLVQDKIRYVYIGLDGGDYVPTDAQTTWKLRFGDCKAKSVLLLALLRRLGVESELVLVNSHGTDEIGQLLPTPAAFDHVVVRVRLPDASYWLDGTLQGGRALSADQVYAYRYALPVRAGSADIERLSETTTTSPTLTSIIHVDASAGFVNPAPAEVETILRADVVEGLRQQLEPLGPVDAERAVKAFMQNQQPWLEVESAAWRYDEQRNTIVLTARGKGKLDLSGDPSTGGSISVFSAGFSPPPAFRRPPDQDASAPWVLPFPDYKHWTTIIHLPPVPKGNKWGYSESSVHRALGGAYFWREATLVGDLFVSSMSRRGLTPELDAQDAKTSNEQVGGFDNSVSTIFLASAKTASSASGGDAIDRVYGLTAQRRLSDALTKTLSGDLLAALEAIELAHQNEPESALILRMRADILSRLGRWKEALSDYELALRIWPLDIKSAKAAETLAMANGVSPPIDFTKPLTKSERREPKP